MEKGNVNANANAILLSNGFNSSSIFEFVCNYIKKNNFKNATIITTAHPKKENSRWAKETKKQLEQVGMKVYFVDFEKKENVANNTDLIYVCGGNTFTLLKHSIEMDFKNTLIDFFNNGGLYIGSSAGSVIIGESVKASSELGKDKNKEKIDTKGFGFIKKEIIPHANFLKESEIKDYMKGENIKDRSRLVEIRDDSAYYINAKDYGEFIY